MMFPRRRRVVKWLNRDGGMDESGEAPNGCALLMMVAPVIQTVELKREGDSLRFES
jgi:hypothetical protein